MVKNKKKNKSKKDLLKEQEMQELLEENQSVDDKEQNYLDEEPKTKGSSKKTKKTKKSKKAFTVEDAITEKRSLLYYAYPPNLAKQIKLMGFPFKVSTTLTTYAIVILLVMILGFIFKLGFPLDVADVENPTIVDCNAIYYLILILAGFLIAPTIVRNGYLNKYELKRFGDVNLYVEQMLYSFKENQKILIALTDVQALFPRGAMREVIDEAVNIIANKRDDDAIDVERYALDVIEKRYPNEQIKAIHRFMKRSEDLGGDNSTSIQILLNQRKNWENRVYKTMDLRKKQKTEIVGSIIATMAMACLMLYILPAEVDIAGNPIAKIANVLLIVISMLIYSSTDKKLSVSLIAPKKIRTDKKILSDYKEYMSYNAKKAIKQSVLLSLIPLAITLVGYLLANNIIMIIGGILFVFILASNILGHKINKKNLLKEVQKAFPQWLMELALMLQSENVQMAIFKTIDNAPVVLKPELIKMKKALIEDPASPSPFLNFFSALELPTVTSTMQMLYSLANGNGGDANTQIMNIIERNNGILERAEEIAAEESMASLYTMFFLPIAVGSGVLLADMTIFLMTYMSSLTPV